jgi:hypothetical protein
VNNQYTEILPSSEDAKERASGDGMCVCVSMMQGCKDESLLMYSKICS